MAGDLNAYLAGVAIAAGYQAFSIKSQDPPQAFLEYFWLEGAHFYTSFRVMGHPVDHAAPVDCSYIERDLIRIVSQRLDFLDVRQAGASVTISGIREIANFGTKRMRYNPR